MDSSPPSEMDYAERVASQNNMDVEVSDPIPSQVEVPSALVHDLSFPALAPTNSYNVAASNLTPVHDETTPQPAPPSVIPYSANVPADPSLWDGDFSATSIFSTNEFLQGDVRNIACSLSRIATFLRQRNLEDHNGNSIP